MKQFCPKLLALAISSALVFPWPAGAQVQSQDEQDERQTAIELESVVVTARGFREELQQTPVPISAVGEEAIQNRGFQGIQDIARYVPGFSFRSAFGRIGDRPVIRGMSNIQGQPNASFFIDGVFVSGSISGYNLDNLERVEVIRGPQSAQFGRRTFAGAINFVTRRPLDVPRVKVSVAGGEADFAEVKALWSGPIIPDRLGAEVNANYRNIDGRFFNNVSGLKDIGGEEGTSAGATLDYRGDRVSAVLRMNYLKNDDQHPAIFRQGSDLNNCLLPTLTGTNIGPFPAADSRRRGYFCGVMDLRPERFGINTPDYAAAGFPAGLEREAWRYSLALDWRLNESWDFKSVSAYNDTEVYTAIDQDYSAIRGFGGAFETFGQSRDFDLSQEFRLISDPGRDVHGQVGAYYYKESSGAGFSGSLAGFNTPPAFNQTRPVANPTRPQGGVENIALFGMLEWRINERWRSSVELRRAEDRVTLGGTNRTTLTIQGQPTVFTRTFRLNDTFTSTTPRFTVSYQATDDLMWYTLAAKGTKPGGFNSDVQNAVLTDAARAELIGAGFESFGEEKAWNYELGFKSDWNNNRFRLNAALFYIDWDDQQLTETRPVDRVDGLRFITSFTTNLGKSEVTGLELESFWQPADGWLVNANYTYLDAKIREYFSLDQQDLFGDASAAGNRLPRVPKHSFNLGLSYDGSLNNGWSWFSSGDVSHESSRFAQIHNLAETGSSTRADFRIGLRPGDNWTVMAWVRNAFDNDTPEDILRYIDPARFISVPNVPGLPGRQVTNVRDFALTAPEPRTWGITVTYAFN